MALAADNAGYPWQVSPFCDDIALHFDSWEQRHPLKTATLLSKQNDIHY
jgi:hypothetical protein